MLDDLIEVIKSKALSFGEFRLRSGQISKYYIDMSKVTLNSKGLFLVANAIIDAVDGRWTSVQSVGGPATGAIPLVSGIVTLMGDCNWNLNAFFVRKETKEYGKNDFIEGHLYPGDNVVLVEDVTTTGGSLLKAVDAVEAAGGKITQVISVLDRNQGATETFEERKIPFKYLISVDKVLNTM